MQKVYLLLRNNKQTGPYSLEELLQLNLKPFDLVWMEGRSAAWQYPSEIPSLKPYVPETPQSNAPFQPIPTSVLEEKFQQAVNIPSVSEPLATPQKTVAPKRVFVSVPKTYAPATEQTTTAPSQSSYETHRAYMPPVEEPTAATKEEIKQTATSYSGSSTSSIKQIPVEEEVHTNYSRSLNDVEEEYTNWMYKQKTKKKAGVNPKDLVLATLILAVIGGGYYIMSKPSVANSVVPANKIATQTTVEETNAQELKETVQPDQQTGTGEVTENAEVKESKNTKTKNPSIVSKSQTRSSVPVVQNSMPVEKTISNIPDDNEVAQKQETRQPSKQDAPAEKKKKFGEVLKGIFSKKEKKEQPKNDAVVLEDPKPATNRQATRREEENPSTSNPASNEASTANLMEQIDLTSNAPDNWMLGVKNLKITLRNRSNTTIQTAAVTVNYYNENNDLLEKKLVYFNNVAPKGRATVAAPDHKFADHVDFKLTSASAKEDRYAKN
jgi:hypothetical protein